MTIIFVDEGEGVPQLVDNEADEEDEEEEESSDDEEVWCLFVL